MASSASSACLSGPKFDLENSRRAFECPVTCELLTKAVTLTPCMHSLQEDFARKYFQTDLKDRRYVVTQDSGNKTCPSCRAIVSSFSPNATIRNMVEAVKIMLDQMEKMRSDVVMQEPQRKFLKVERKEQIKSLPYPGKRSIFKYFSGDWKTPLLGIYNKILDFTSTTGDSFINRFSIRELEDGRITIQIHWNFYDNTKVEDYFDRFKITIGNTSYIQFYQTQGLLELKTMFDILVANNEIQQPYLDKIKAIVDSAK